MCSRATRSDANGVGDRRGHEGEVVHERGRGQESIRRILMDQIDRPALKGNLVVQGSFPERCSLAGTTDPCRCVGLQRNASALGKHENLPNDDRREPEVVEMTLKLPRYALR